MLNAVGPRESHAIMLHGLRRFTIRKALAAVAAVFFTLTGALAATVYTTTVNGHTFSYTLDHNKNATIVRSEDYKTFSGLVALPASCGGNNVSAIGDRAFEGCPKLEAVILPNSIERIGAYAFANCPVLSYVGRELESTGGVSILPDKTKHIGVGAFDGTAVLGLSYPPGAYWGIDESTNTTTKTVTIPGWAKAVPNGAFKNFVALETVKIESGVTAIGKGAFEGCKALKSIEIPSTVSTIMDNAFGDCYVEGKVVRIQSIESWCQVDFEGSSANPLSNGGFGRAELWVMGSRATDLQIPATVREIKPYVFVKLDLPGDLEIPGQVKKIGEHAFAGLCCGGEISFGEGLEEIGEQAFYGAAFDRVRESETAVGTIEFPRSLKKIGEQAFNSFDNLGTVKFGGVREVGEGAFERCSRLVALDFGASSSVTNIGRKAFANCDSLCFAVIPASVVCMGTQVFSASWRLSKVCYQGNCPRILPWGSEKVNDVTIADFASYVRPGSRGWNGTPGSTDKPLNWEGGRLGSWDESGLLVRPNADGSEHAIGGCMLAGTRLVTLPAEVGGVAITSIAPRAFEGDTAITGVTVADGIRDVGAHAFSESFVSDVILPNSVSNIGERAFGEMLPYLRTLAVGEGLVNVAPDAFEGNFTQKPTVTVYSPAEKVEMLQTVFKGTEPEIFPRYIDKIVFKTDEGAPKITTATIRLTWNPNGGWDTQRGWDTPPQTFQEGVTVAAVLQASPVPARQGYHFRGWSFSLEKWLPADDPSRQSMSLTENQTLYAWWTAATDGQIYVTWDAMDGEVSPTELKVARGIKVKDLLMKAPKPTRTGWTFGGWYWDVDLTDPLNDPDSQNATIEFDVIFFAKWTGEMVTDISGVEPAYTFVTGTGIEPIIPTVAEGWKVKVTGLPSGLKAASNTGVVSGKPTKAGTFQVKFTATKSGAKSVSVETAITVWKTYTVTFGAAGMRGEASDAEGRFAPVSAEGAKGSKLAAVGGEQTVTVTAPETTVDKKDNKLVFQKWTVSPSSVILSGEGYNVQSNAVSFLMPEANVTLTPTYVEAAKCGWLTAYGWSDDVVLGWNGDTHEYDRLLADENDMQWSPDGGKTWYASGERAMLTAGRYTVQWRSTSPLWAAPKDKEKVEVRAGEDVVREDYFAYFSFVPNVVVDLQAPDGGVPEGCSATMNPKDGRVPDGKSVTLTAKPSTDYAFQGWYLRLWDYWHVEPVLESVSTSYKLVNELDWIGEGFLTDSWYICPEDYKVHMIAKFKAVKDYRQEDLISNFNGIGGPACSEVRQIDDEHVELTVHGMTGCALDYDIETKEAVWPLTFKQTSGKLPKGLKFDAKKGKISGTPTAKDGESVSCVFTLTDPAKNVLNVTVNFEIRPLQNGLAGDYRALVHLPREQVEVKGLGWVWRSGKPDGLLEMSVSTAGKVSAKILYEGGSVSFSGTLAWHPDENDPALPGSMGVDLSGKKNADLGYAPYLRGVFNEDGTMSFDWDVADYCEGARRYLLGEGETAYRQDKDLYAKSAFREKYYTFAFGTTNAVDEANSVEGGYGYLTVKTDKKGVAKVAGKLPDGTAVSANALVLPFAPADEEPTAENITARLFFFNVPSDYKKQGWCAMDLALDPSGKTAIGLDLSDPQAAAWFQASTYQPPASAYCYWDDPMYPTEWEIASSLGAFYSPAATLTNYYWCALCPADDRVAYEYKCKSGSESWNEMAAAQTFDGTLFAVELAGDKKGSVVLREKSPAPWKNAQGEWVYDEDKNGKPITDPSQLSISFTKATGIFSGKTNFYFDYNDGSKNQHQKVSVPYAGVMVDSPDGLQGFGSAVFSNKRTGTYIDYRNEQEKPFTYTEKVSLPVTLAPFAQE